MNYLIANWKAQVTVTQVQSWTTEFLALVATDQTLQTQLADSRLTLVICPPFPFLGYVQEQFKSTPGLKVGAQTLSSFEEGKFTGEVTAKALQGIVDFAIVGHSERRSTFHESNIDIQAKLGYCRKYSIEPILCVRDNQDHLFADANIIAYEPPAAIGTGNNAAVKDVLTMKKTLQIPDTKLFLYGGSADETNCKEYLETGEVQGFLVGKAALNPRSFYTMAKQF